MPFRPSPIPTVFVAGAIVVLVNLGLWQVRRHGETSALLEQTEQAQQLPPLTSLSGEEDLNWRIARLSGSLGEDVAFVTGRFEFGEPGLDVYQCLRTDADAVLVNRGWIPLNGFEANSEQVLTTHSQVEVEGLVLAASQQRTDFVYLEPTKTSPPRWSGPAWEQIRAKLGCSSPWVVTKGPNLTHGGSKSRSTLPVGGFIGRPKFRPHVEYAGTWFLIAVALSGLWVWAGFRRGAMLADQG